MAYVRAFETTGVWHTPLEFGFLWEGREKGLRPW